MYFYRDKVLEMFYYVYNFYMVSSYFEYNYFLLGFKDLWCKWFYICYDCYIILLFDYIFLGVLIKWEICCIIYLLCIVWVVCVILFIMFILKFVFVFFRVVFKCLSNWVVLVVKFNMFLVFVMKIIVIW